MQHTQWIALHHSVNGPLEFRVIVLHEQSEFNQLFSDISVLHSLQCSVVGVSN